MSRAFATLRLGPAAAALALALPGPVSAQSPTTLADMQEDIRGLSQRLNELSLRVEQLEHENAELRAKAAASGGRELVTTAQLNAAEAQLDAAFKAEVADTRTEILAKVGTQMEKLANQTNAALDSLAKSPASPHAPAAAVPDAATGFGDGYSKQGISYTVVKGDTVGLIAHKTGAKVQDIVDANRLADPSKIRLGQVLFIPGGKVPTP